MIFRAAVMFLAFVCAAGFAGANTAPCPMPDETVNTVTVKSDSAHAGHSDGGDCSGHTQPDCNHTSLADCAGLSATVRTVSTVGTADGFETANPAPPDAGRIVFPVTATVKPDTFYNNAPPPLRQLFLLTQRILV